MTTKLKPVDAVVVGSGVAGSIICMELANAGLKVLCIERGRMIEPQHDFVMPYVHDELKFDRHSDIFQNLSRETITFRNHMSETALPMDSPRNTISSEATFFSSVNQRKAARPSA